MLGQCKQVETIALWPWLSVDVVDEARNDEVKWRKLCDKIIGTKFNCQVHVSYRENGLSTLSRSSA